MAGRYAAQEADKEIAEHKRLAHTLAGAAGRGTSAVLGGAARLGGIAAGVMGGFGVADVIRERFAAERQAAQLVNAVTTGKAPPAGANVNNILAQAGKVSVETGMSKEEVVSGTLAYARKARGGDFEGAMGNMAFFAKMSKVTGTSIDELAGAAGTLQSQNAGLKTPAMQQMLLNAYAQSKAGSVSLSEAAAQIGTLASTRGLYQGDEATNQRKLLGLGQIAASGGASGDVGTYIKDVTLEAAAHRHSKGHLAGLENLGVKFNKQGEMESPEQMIGAVFKGTGGDLSKIHEYFGNRGMPLFTELKKSFEAAGGGDKGVAAVQSQIGSVTNASMTSQELESQFAQVMSTSAEKFAHVAEELKEKAERLLIPWIEKLSDKLPLLVPEIEHLFESLARVAEWLGENPWLGLGTVIVGTITKDLAGAAIGQGVKNVLMMLLNGSNVGGSGAGIPGVVGGAAGGVASKVLGVVGAAGVGASVGYAISDAALSQQTGRQGAGSTGQILANNTMSELRGGKITPAQIQERLATLKGLQGKANDVGMLDKEFAKYAGFFSPDSKKTADRAAAEQGSDMSKAIAALTAALQKNTEVTARDSGKVASIGTKAPTKSIGERPTGSQ